MSNPKLTPEITPQVVQEVVVKKEVNNMPTTVSNPSDWAIQPMDDDTIEATMGAYRFVGTMVEFNSLIK
jgi:hypothetical protein